MEKSHKNLDKSVIFTPGKKQAKKARNVEKTHSCKSLELPHLFLCLEFFVSLCLLMPRKLDQNMSSCGETKFDFAILQWLDKKRDHLKKTCRLKHAEIAEVCIPPSTDTKEIQDIYQGQRK